MIITNEIESSIRTSVIDQPELQKPIFQHTKHEVLFGIMFPHFRQQVSFGTGKNGFKKWGVKRYTADFYDEKHSTIYEIDGSSHRSDLSRIKDKIRDLFFVSIGIETVRISNEFVEKLYIGYLKGEIEQNGEQYQQAFREFFRS